MERWKGSSDMAGYCNPKYASPRTPEREMRQGRRPAYALPVFSFFAGCAQAREFHLPLNVFIITSTAVTDNELDDMCPWPVISKDPSTSIAPRLR